MIEITIGTETEFKKYKSALSKLPEGTLVTIYKSKLPYKDYKLKDGNFVTETDYHDLKRSTWLSKEEELEFEKLISTKTKLFTWWFSPDPHLTREREYSKAIDFFSNISSNITKTGTTYKYDPKDWNSLRRILNICLYTDTDLTPVNRDLNIAIKAFKKVNPDFEEFYISIFESTLSEFGVYSASYNYEEDKYYLHKTTYGSKKVIKEFSKSRDLLEYIAKHHPYKKEQEDY